ncbi:TPA: winged helix-turn-helix transcriptional regulator [Candidatus Micrarchaeota archaeon]|nr:winged helix-turn-helix transcriptional regulator [Candidatus Micrarchaeota archaeon]
MDGKVDNIDMRILYELDWNARQSDAELARKIRRSRETVRYRINQLEKRKIIKGYTTWINPSKLGYDVYKIYMKIKGSEAERKAFFDDMKSQNDVFWVGGGGGA